MKELHSETDRGVSNPPVTSPWHTQAPQAVVTALNTDAIQGLSTTEAQTRLTRYGANMLVENGQRSVWRLLWEQLTAVMVLILLAAMVLSIFLGKYLEASAIGAIVALFVALGFFQEYRAEKAIAALKKLAVPTVRVMRNGSLCELPAGDLVPGDLVALEAGNVVPADVRILSSANLRIQEAALTGESEPVEKTTAALALADAPLGDRRNMGYMGTQVTYGRGAAVVTATGMHTELGRIATLLQTVDAGMTPLQRKLDNVGKLLAAAGVAVAALMVGIGLAVGETLGEMLVTAIGVAVAVIPEGLPAVVTFTLAVGAQRMLKRNALIRKLPAVETLGSVTIIASDKTGTLTENRMTVTVIAVDQDRVDLLAQAHQHAPAATEESLSRATAQPAPAIQMLLAAAALCNDAELPSGPDNGKLAAIGDPTEGALLVAAAQHGLDITTLRSQWSRTAELPFDSDRKRMTTIHARPQMGGPAWLQPLLSGHEHGYLSVTKGAIDGLLDLSTHIWSCGQAQPMTAALRAQVEAQNDELARAGMRVLGVSVRWLSAPDTNGAETGLTFVGLTGMIDPPRPEVRAAVQRSLQAGIRPLMITGDHPLTASYIARDLGITSDDQVLTGAELDRMDDAALTRAVTTVSVFARVSPEHKLRIVAALQHLGHIVAMTGDGVNDAPALKKADIGVAMGITGTDVSKEASDMVLRDDNFATIVAAVEEGRVIYDNLRRFVKFAVAGNLGKIMVMLLWPAIFFVTGTPATEAIALLPLQLLWLNLMTDGLLGLSMGAEPAEPNVMRRPPHNPQEGIFAHGMGVQVLWSGALIGVLTLLVGGWYYVNGLPQWQTMIFMTLAVLQIFQAFATRSNTASLLAIGLFSNRLMLYAAGGVFALQLLAIYVPPFSSVFLQTQPLSGFDLGITLLAGLVLFSIIELEKLIQRRRRHAHPATAHTEPKSSPVSSL